LGWDGAGRETNGDKKTKTNEPEIRASVPGPLSETRSARQCGPRKSCNLVLLLQKQGFVGIEINGKFG
jgi:hypothetical protein